MDWHQCQKAIDAGRALEGSGFRIFRDGGITGGVTVQDLIEGWYRTFRACSLRLESTDTWASHWLCDGRSQVLADERIAAALAGRIAEGHGPLAAGELAVALLAGSSPHPAEVSLRVPRPSTLRRWIEQTSQAGVDDRLVEQSVLVWTLIAHLGGRAARDVVHHGLVSLGHTPAAASEAIRAATTRPSGGAVMTVSRTDGTDYLWPAYPPYYFDETVPPRAQAKAHRLKRPAFAPSRCTCEPRAAEPAGAPAQPRNDGGDARISSLKQASSEGTSES